MRTVISRIGRRGLDDLLDAQPGDVSQVARDRERCEHDGEVGLDRLAGVVEHRPGSQVGLGHPEGLLDVVESAWGAVPRFLAVRFPRPDFRS
jgi:hypothetical protein